MKHQDHETKGNDFFFLALHKLSLSGAKETPREKYGELWILCKNCL